jgi:transcriptional regulator with XRE-family HTH domain
MNIAENLRKARERSGLTQTELAEKTGIDQRQISRYENGQICKYDKLVLIAEALNISPSNLLN